MNGNALDILAQILWYSIPATPLITIPIVWKYSKERKIIRVFIGLIFAIALSVVLFIFFFAIAFKDIMFDPQS